MTTTPIDLCASMSGVLRLPENTSGRDFICGDLHGRTDLLATLLESVHFDSRDRLIFVGDLIDRGSDSAGAIQLLSQPNVFSCRGNHELHLAEIVTDAMRSEWRFDDVVRQQCRNQIMGTDWVIDALAENGRDWLIHTASALACLPPIIVIDGPRRRNIVHAGALFKKVIVSDVVIDAIDTLPSEAKSRFIDEICFSRGLHGKIPLADNPGLSPTFCGHTIVDEPFFAHGHVMIDTGAVAGDGLTLIESQSGLWHRWDGHQLRRGQIELPFATSAARMVA